MRRLNDPKKALSVINENFEPTSFDENGNVCGVLKCDCSVKITIWAFRCGEKVALDDRIIIIESNINNFKAGIFPRDTYGYDEAEACFNRIFEISDAFALHVENNIFGD